MRTCLLVDKNEWKKDEIESFLSTKNLEYKAIRVGFTYYCVLFPDQINLSAFSSIKKIYAVYFDHPTQTLASVTFKFENEKVYKKSTEILLTDKTSGLGFDLRNTGFMMKSDGDFNQIRRKIIGSMTGISNEVITVYDCKKVIENDKIPSNLKKIVLDIYSLLMSDLFLLGSLSSIRNRNEPSKNFVNYYTQIICGTFIIRAIIEKLILLISDWDANISFKEVQGSKSIKRAFLKRAKKSEESITLKFADFLSSVEILESKYRTPEIHKLGRVIGLLNADVRMNHLSMINEIMAYRNTAANTFNHVCNQIHETFNNHKNK